MNILKTTLALSLLVQPGLRAEEPMAMEMPEQEQDMRGCGCNKPRPTKPTKACDDMSPDADMMAMAEDCTKGCGCANRPKPRPNRPGRPKQAEQPVSTKETADAVKELAQAIVADATAAQCIDDVPQPVRAWCECDAVTPDNVLAAMPTLMHYAREWKKSDMQKGEAYVAALMAYMDKHAEMLKSNPAWNDVMAMMESDCSQERCMLPECM